MSEHLDCRSPLWFPSREQYLLQRTTMDVTKHRFYAPASLNTARPANTAQARQAKLTNRNAITLAVAVLRRTENRTAIRSRGDDHPPKVIVDGTTQAGHTPRAKKPELPPCPPCPSESGFVPCRSRFSAASSPLRDNPTETDPAHETIAPL